MEYFNKTYFHTPAKEELESSIYITWAGHIKCSPEYSNGAKTNEQYNMVLIVDGKGLLTVEETEFNLQSGDLFILVPGLKHSYSVDPNDPWEMMWVSFNGKACVGILNYLNLNPEHPVINRIPTNNIIHFLKNIIFELKNNDNEYALIATAFLYRLFSELIPFTKKTKEQKKVNLPEESIEKALTFIDINYCNRIDVNILCHHVNFSRSHLSRIFKKKLKISIPQYINKVRIQKAKILLTETTLNINEVANSVGFKNQFYFSKVFRELEGQSPSFYKTNNRKII